MRRNTIILTGAALIALTFLLLVPAPGVPILAYHMVNDLDEPYSISPGEFEEQMAYLAKQGYTSITLAQLLDGMEGKKSLPPKPIVITFDDGYTDNAEIALPIMARYRMNATIFIIAGHAGEPPYMSWDEIKAIQRTGTEIGSHTYSHEALSEIDPADQLYEVLESKKTLEAELQQSIGFLAYPYGKFSPAVVDALQQAGYRGACSGKAGLNKPGTDPYILKRVNVPQPKFGLWEFRLRLLRAEIYSKLNL